MRAEDIARQALRSDGAAEQLANPSSVVKHEEIPAPSGQISVSDNNMFTDGTLVDAYQPSNALLESFEMLEQSRVTTGKDY
jgi:hypothetical protein